MKLSLGCNGYQVTRNVGEPVYIDARLILMDVSPRQIEEVAEAMSRIEKYFSGRIMLLRDDGTHRCFYCGVKQDKETGTCSQCGAPL